jgi:hypothetical protein
MAPWTEKDDRRDRAASRSLVSGGWHHYSRHFKPRFRSRFDWRLGCRFDGGESLWEHLFLTVFPKAKAMGASDHLKSLLGPYIRSTRAERVQRGCISQIIGIWSRLDQSILGGIPPQLSPYGEVFGAVGCRRQSWHSPAIR